MSMYICAGRTIIIYNCKTNNDRSDQNFSYDKKSVSNVRKKNIQFVWKLVWNAVMKDSVKTIALRTGTILHAIISTFSKDNLRYELNETKLFWTLSAVMDFDGGIYLWVCEHVAESIINAN